jgi:hypothetical protein
MEICIWVNIYITNHMVMVNIFGKIKINISVISIKAVVKETDYGLPRMDRSFKVNIIKIKEKDTVFIVGLMEIYMKENSKMI